MEHYVGLDVSLELTAICIVDQTGKIEREGVVPSDPEAIAAFIKSHAPLVARVGLETGATATWLWTELNKLGLPVICIDARHAKAALKMQINKSDRNDAVGIARIMQCGWYKEVRVKDLDSHAVKGLLVSRVSARSRSLIWRRPSIWAWSTAVAAVAEGVAACAGAPVSARMTATVSR
jgi:transposase